MGHAVGNHNGSNACAGKCRITNGGNAIGNADLIDLLLTCKGTCGEVAYFIGDLYLGNGSSVQINGARLGQSGHIRCVTPGRQIGNVNLLQGMAIFEGTITHKVQAGTDVNALQL